MNLGMKLKYCGGLVSSLRFLLSLIMNQIAVATRLVHNVVIVMRAITTVTAKLPLLIAVCYCSPSHLTGPFYLWVEAIIENGKYRAWVSISIIDR